MVRGSSAHDGGSQLARVLAFEQVRRAEVRPADPAEDARIEPRRAHENGFQETRVAVAHPSEDPSEEQLGLALAEVAGLCMAAELPRELLGSGAIGLVVLVVLGLPPQS